MITYRKEFISTNEKQKQEASEAQAKKILKTNPFISAKELVRTIRQNNGVACERVIKTVYMEHRRSL